MADDRSGRNSADSTAPARGAIAITPADTDMTVFVKALYVGTSGTVKVRTMNDEDVSFVNIVGILPIACKRVYSTGTTASNIVGLY